ncbi:hypothetical protein ES703_39816 [subsurface metagenome]
MMHQPLWRRTLDDPRSLALTPLVMMCMQLEAIILREWEIARGIFILRAKEADVYLSHVEKFKGAARNTVDRIYESEQ